MLGKNPVKICCSAEKNHLVLGRSYLQNAKMKDFINVSLTVCCLPNRVLTESG